MKICLNPQLIKDLKHTLSNSNVLFYSKMGDFKKVGDYSKTENKNAFNCLCACNDRIEDIVDYLNNLEIDNSKQSVFKLYELLNNGQTLIDCITEVANIYECSYDDYLNCDSFNQKGLNGNGNDEKYFSYLRSLCSVHPSETTMHKVYQGNEQEWCPYVSRIKGSIYKLTATHDGHEKADFVATIYKNNDKNYKHEYIYLEQIFDYLQKRYNFISKIIVSVEEYNDKKIKELKATKIKNPDEFPTYNDYLSNLEKEIFIREGNSDYKAREWISIFNTKFKCTKTNQLFNSFKEAIKIEIQRIQNALQTLECLDDNFNFELFDYNLPSLIKYLEQDKEVDKLCTGSEFEYIEDFNQEFIDKENDFDVEFLSKIIDGLDEERSAGISDEDLMNICYDIAAIHNVDGSIWARMMLKIEEPAFHNVIKFDYTLNNWHLYLQVEIAKWLLSKEQKIDN